MVIESAGVSIRPPVTKLFVRIESIEPRRTLDVRPVSRWPCGR